MAEVLAGTATFPEWVEWFVQIESDAQHRGPIPFALYPYQRTRAIAWEAGDSEVILKARQLGFSWLAAAFAVWTAAYHESSHVAVFSAGAREMRALMRKMRYIIRRLPADLRGGAVIAIESIVFANESMISGFPSTPDAGIGETNRLVIFDEWAVHPFGEANLSAVLPTIAAGGQLLGMSTANPEIGPTGHFHDAYRAAEAGENGFSAVFVPWWSRPERQTPQGQPNLEWLARERARYSTLSPEALNAWYPSHAEDAFTGRTGLVYGTDDLSGVRILDPKRNVVSPSCDWVDCKWRLAAVDPGGADPTALLALGVSEDDRLSVYAEYSQHGAMSAMDISDWLVRVHERGELDLVFVDPSQASMVASLHQLGWPAYPALNAKLEGIGVVKRLLMDGRLTIPPEMTKLLHEMDTYWWPTRKHLAAGGNPADTRTAADHHADLADCLRYAVLGVIKGLPRHRGRVEHEWRDGIVPKRPRSFKERMAAKTGT